jgi:hypothetical protein
MNATEILVKTVSCTYPRGVLITGVEMYADSIEFVEGKWCLCVERCPRFRDVLVA